MRLASAKKYLFSSQKSFFRGFSLVDNMKADDLNLQVTRLLHQKSGAMVYNIKANDNDNAFSPIVRTLPENDTGCPHILEHLACCGSERYPIRDPFYNMLKRSVNTFMNAWTGDDSTAYPFSTANSKDFANLYKVYLDMCLKPNLNQLDFRQEGWRYEINAQNNEKQLKGIVFNEMKGAYQNPDRQLYIQLASKLYTNTPYGYDSGGKPQAIVKLSYEQVKNMHRYYYHPSNMAFYYYGDSDIKDKLAYLQDEYLLKYDYRNDINKYILKNKELNSRMPQKMDQISYTVTSSTAQTPNIGITYNLDWLDKIDQVDLTCLSILSYLLLQTNQAIFYQQFIQSQLADSFGWSGLNISSLIAFGITLKNTSINAEEVLQRVQRCLQQIVEKGVDSQRLDQYVIQAQLHILAPKKTQGIYYLQHYSSHMINRLTLNSLVNIRANLNAAVKKLKNKDELKILINKYFLANDCKVVVRQQPAKTKVDEYKSIKGLDIDEDIIKTQQKQLKQRQQSSESNSVDCLPKLSLSDLVAPKQPAYTIIKSGFRNQSNSLKELYVNIDKKDINFVRMAFKIDMKQKDNQQIWRFLDIWRYAVRQGIAVRGLTNKQVSAKLNSCAHNFDVTYEKGSPNTEPNSIIILFSAQCLDTTLDEYINIVHKIIFEPDFKTEDLANIFRSYKTEKTEQLLDGNAMQFCLDYGSSLTTEQGRIFNSYYLVTEGMKIAENGSIPKQFGLIHDRLQNGSDLTLIQHSHQYRNNIIEKLGIKYGEWKKESLKKQKVKQQPKVYVPIAVTNSYDVNFCSQQYPGPEHLSKQHAQITLLIQVLEQDYLHPKIRQKGGAYGARAMYRQVSTIALYSYMDPYSTQTYATFDQSIKQILLSQISNERLEQVKIKVIGAIDRPIIPQNQCIPQILKNFTNQQKNQFRNYIREAIWVEVLSTGRKYLNDNLKNRVMFGKDVPQGFAQQKLKIRRQDKLDEGLKGDATHQVYDSS